MLSAKINPPTRTVGKKRSKQRKIELSPNTPKNAVNRWMRKIKSVAQLSFLEFRDSRVVLKDIAQLVQVFEDAGFGKRIDRERGCRPAIDRKRLVFQIDCHLGAWLQHRMRLGRDHNRQEPVLECILTEDIRKARRDDRFEAVIRQCPDGVLAGTSACEVIAGH